MKKIPLTLLLMSVMFVLGGLSARAQARGYLALFCALGQRCNTTLNSCIGTPRTDIGCYPNAGRCAPFYVSCCNCYYT